MHPMVGTSARTANIGMHFNSRHSVRAPYEISALDMVPDAQETLISLAVGDTHTFTFNYNAAPFAFHPDAPKGAVAFIQNDPTKEVLQAAFFNYASLTGIASGEIGSRHDFTLYPNYPNPFNSSTEISYSIPAGKKTTVNLSIYNTLKHTIRKLFDGMQAPGKYRIVWDGSDEPLKAAASGLYTFFINRGQCQTILNDDTFEIKKGF